MTLAELLKQLQQQISLSSQTPRLDAEIIITTALQKPRTIIYTDSNREITAAEKEFVLTLMQRRLQGEPMAYLIGEKEFWSLTLEVTKDTLIPRPETEHLIEWALKHLVAEKNLNIADLGTGSGAIALALAHERPNWQIHATDKSFAALQVAIRNANRLQLNNISFYQGDWFAAIPNLKFDAIFSNPPYIAEQDPHWQSPELQFEPRTALASGVEGLDALQIIIKESQQQLNKNGWLALEHGYDQANRLHALLDSENFHHIQTFVDLAELPRFTVAQK